MLPSKQRLSRTQVTEFLTLQQVQGKKTEIRVVFNRLGTLKYVIWGSDPQITIVTSSKNQKKAVLRNKLRRRIYSVVRQYPEIAFTGMLYVSKNSYEMSFADIKQQVYGLLQKINQGNK